MKIINSVIVVLLCSFALFSQNEGEIKVVEYHSTTESQDSPIIGDNNAFGYGYHKANVNVNYFNYENENIWAFFLNYGINENYSLSTGLIDIDGTKLIYITPERHVQLTQNVTLGVELKVIINEEFDDFITNPSAMLSFGTSKKNLSFGYGFIVDSDFKDIDGMSVFDRTYALAGFKINGRLPINKSLALFTKNDIVSDNGFTYIQGRTGIEINYERAVIYGGTNFLFFSNKYSNTKRVYFFLGSNFTL